MQGIKLRLHPGGMMQATPISADFRQHVLESDKRIEQQTGQPFGADYLKKVASGESLILDSYITAQAIIASDYLGYSTVDMLEKIQQAHYQQGLPVYQAEVLTELAGQFNVEAKDWNAAMAYAEGRVEAEIQLTRHMMQQAGLGGFPSMLIEQNGHRHTVAISQFYRRPEQWRQFWVKVLEGSEYPFGV